MGYGNKMLAPGQTRKIMPRKYDQYDVTAECYDSDTPLIHITRKRDGEHIITLGDTSAAELVEKLQRALAVLPTSK